MSQFRRGFRKDSRRIVFGQGGQLLIPDDRVTHHVSTAQSGKRVPLQIIDFPGTGRLGSDYLDIKVRDELSGSSPNRLSTPRTGGGTFHKRQSKRG